MGLIILYFLGALSLSFLCSVLEAVLLSTPMSFISMKENQGNKTASLMKQYKNNVDRPVGAILSLLWYCFRNLSLRYLLRRTTRLP